LPGCGRGHLGKDLVQQTAKRQAGPNQGRYQFYQKNLSEECEMISQFDKGLVVGALIAFLGLIIGILIGG
jgi:hypothetical protein